MKADTINIREEKASDIGHVWQLNTSAFETETEANLVNALRKTNLSFLSLVAELDNHIVGHILFTPVTFSGIPPTLKITGLAPMAVLKDHQRKGIGAKLIKEGIKWSISEDYDAIVVLGHHSYYPKFGFVSASQYGIKSEYDVPDDVFMALELKPGVLKGAKGRVKYHEAFAGI
ncbi:MAG: N-acetyltransferase [Desulfobacterales bacterium]|nr:N-acetyltransferase [Desulfobacterales bacterium]